MNKKQMQIASQISKRKALHPPCAKDEKKLQCYYEGKIAVLPDVIDVTTAVDFTGTRYDMGNKLGILQATVEVGLQHPEIGQAFRAYLKELSKTL